METSGKLNTLLALAVLLLRSVDAQLTLQMPQKSVEVIQGQMVVLQAWYTSSANKNNNVIWNLVENSSFKQVISFMGGTTILGDSQLKNRVGFMHAMPSSNLSIYINNTQEPDSGRYACQVFINGESSSDSLILTVKVPPSVPVCSLIGKPVLNGSVTLSCNSQSGKPPPLYSWAKVSPDTNVFFAPHMNVNTGTLKLANLTSRMSGKYVCNASNTAGTESCYINLEVITATNAGVIAGATVAAVIGLILIILIIIFLWTRKKDTEDDLANEIKEDAQAPKRVSWAKSGSGSDIVSKNGTLSSVHTSPHVRDGHHNNLYVHRPGSDTASIVTATGSTAGYRPRPLADTTPERTLPGYNTSSTLPHSSIRPPTANGASQQRTDHAQPQTPRPPPLPTGITAANISRMGGVPIMVPAQNQAGSLV
ncbi:endothelial cell adhesion molecule a [Denticeps clupeoides]|uniref:Ig-like domain-containing protein n=1 Tax=Denticeps clupeoides TaxID=299321 RepID=A0AAY4AI53_9TELE|nr:endothelial cell-selective adhesion molecule [Denticeps clupeoides]